MRRKPRENFPPRTGDEEKSMEFDGRLRTYLVHRPPAHHPSRATPLVLVLHGGTANAYFTAYNTGMNTTADREGFIAVYPNGTGRTEDRILTWNVGFGFAYALRNNVDDVGFLRALVVRVVDEYGADPARVYATGISNGGIMSYRLASEASDAVVAVSPIAGASAGQKRCGSPMIAFPPPRRPVSVMAFHGLQDPMIPFQGGPGAGLVNAVYPPVQQSVDMWVGYDGCSPKPEVTTSPTGNVTREWYSGGCEGSEVVLYTIRDGGHSWPGGVPLAGPGATGAAGRGRLARRFMESLGPTTQEISANDLMWEFFKRHSRAR